MGSMIPIHWQQQAKFLMEFNHLSYVSVVWYLEHDILIEYICLPIDGPSNTCLYWCFLSLLGIQKGRISESPHLPLVFTVLDKHQSF